LRRSHHTPTPFNLIGSQCEGLHFVLLKGNQFL